MKYKYLLISLATLAISCSYEEINSLEADTYGSDVFYATIDEQPDAETKVYADENLKVLWNADDRITIFNKIAYNQEYRFTGVDGDNSGTFKKVPNDDFATGTELERIYAVYPYRESTRISNSCIITTAIPSEQTYLANSFGRGANTMVASAGDNLLRFKNVGGYLSLKFYGEGVSVSSITLKSNNGEFIAGDCTVDMSSGLPVSNLITANASDAITMVCDPPIELPAEKTDAVMAIFVLSPGTLTGGVTVTVTTSDGGVFEKSTSNKLEIGRSAITRLGALEVVPEYAQPDNVIYYTSSDGEIVTPVKEDAFGASIISNEYIDGRGIITFDGVVKTIGPNAFSNKPSLTSIAIPDSVTSIDDVAFYQCSSLVSVTIPDSVIAIGGWAFQGCSKLVDITIPDSVTSIGEGVFRYCYALKSFYGKFASLDGLYLINQGNIIAIAYSSIKGDIAIPDGVTGIDGWVFANCSNITSVFIPESVTNVGAGAFDGCTSLLSFSGKYASSDGLYLIDQGCILAATHGFVNGRVTIPEGVTKINSCVFVNRDDLLYIVIPDSITNIGNLAFEYCLHLSSITVLSKIPPLGGYYMFHYTNNCPIYVPAESVETYKTAQYWSDYADRIQSIPDLSITDLTLDVTELELAKESSYSFTATVYPENSTDKDIVWASSNEAVATITSEGVMTALKVGNTTVSAECGGIKAYCSVTVVPKSDPSFYSSTDYSKDGEVILLQQATVGNGINIIFLGDGFLDKDMDNGGKYDQIMRSAMEQFFVYEPYKTFRNRFNVYAVRVVSCNEVYGTEDSNRRLTYNEGNLIYMKTGLCTEYGEVVPNPDNQPLRMAVVCNTENRVGRSICYWNSSGWSCCFVFDAIGDVLNHEFGGHGFANLRDEYVERNETFADFDGLDQDYNKWGWGANVDWRSDPSSIRWNRFLSDSRYEGEGLGIFEGGNLYAYGIYRASENSMMRYNNCPFNAPSREQIYKRIMKYSEGDNWEYNYETFVSYDEGGRIQAAEAFSKNAKSSVSKRSPEYIVMDYPPLVIDKDVKVVGVDINGKAQIKR